jgi:hypothetical protein
MGHEIVYCYWCSGRILGVDFDKGAAVLIGNHACCSQCLPKVMASLPANQRETLLEELSKAGPPPPGRNTPRSGTNLPSNRTPRVGSPVPASPGDSKPPMLFLAIGGGVLVLIVLVMLMMSGGKAEKSDARTEPSSSPAPKPPGSDREKTARDAVQKARDAARSGIDIDLQVRLWDEAVSKSERTPSSDEATQERSMILVRRKEVYAQELTRLMDSVDGILRDDQFKKALEALASARKRHDSPDWNSEIDRKVENVKKLEAGGGPYFQGTDAEGLICIEAERFHRKTDIGEHAWTVVTQPAGFTGAGAAAALPNKGTGWQKDLLSTCPRLDYRIQFVIAGKHYLWVRGYADSGTEDSIHLGLDGAETPSAAGMTITIKKGGWTRRTMSNVNASVDVTPGTHTLNLWPREDGVIVVGSNDDHPSTSPRIRPAARLTDR